MSSLPWSLRAPTRPVVFALVAGPLSLVPAVAAAVRAQHASMRLVWLIAILSLFSLVIGGVVADAKSARDAVTRAAVALVALWGALGWWQQSGGVAQILAQASLFAAPSLVAVSPLVVMAGYARSTETVGARVPLVFAAGLWTAIASLLASIVLEPEVAAPVRLAIGAVGCVVGAALIVAGSIAERAQSAWFERVYESKQSDAKLRVPEPSDPALPHYAEPRERNTVVLCVAQRDDASAYRAAEHWVPVLRVPATVREARDPRKLSLEVPMKELLGTIAVLLLAPAALGFVARLLGM